MINEMEEVVTKAIQQATMETIPQRLNNVIKKPETNTDYQELPVRYHQEKDPMKKKTLAYDVRKMRTKLKIAYFGQKAAQLNFASEQRNTEEEFRLMKRHTSLTCVNRLLIHLGKLEEHFSKHFSA